MRNAEVVKILQDIADLLELKGENQFKIRAYQRAARSIEHFPQSVEQLVKEGRLNDIPGVGEGIGKKLNELFSTGHLKYYEELRSQFPSGTSALLDVPGIGPKTAIKLSGELGISSLCELEEALQEGKVASLYRLGDKIAQNIEHHLKLLRSKESRIPIGVALPVAENVISSLKSSPIINLTAAGSLRRFKETVGDIDILGTSDRREEVLNTFAHLPEVKEVLALGETKSSVIVADDLQVDLRVVPHDSFGSSLQYFTGSKDHNIKLRERGRRQGLKLSEYGITELDSGVMHKFTHEEDFYHWLGLSFIPPELREGAEEIELAQEASLPHLLELPNIRGDFHVHTDWSDGQNSVEEMAVAAKDMGYEFITITDHSRGRGVAHGLDEERVLKQLERIREVEGRVRIHILSGIEVDIRADGNLDLPDSVLSKLDVVIASVHSSFSQDRDRMTKRMLSAIENSQVDILGHPSGRLLGEREEVALDFETLFSACKETKTVLEINCQPKRLDLKDSYIREAIKAGVKLSLGSDAHTISQLQYMHFGVGIARRGWCESKHVLNTLSFEEVRQWMKEKVCAPLSI
jgi:DNA polymerase (family 10)